MKIRSIHFELSAVRPNQWPRDGLLEFAFIGRSNVGKSSLLNRILGRKSLARVSQKPGKTQQINFFRINELFRFVDLPGYGYAALSKSDRVQLARIIETYLRKREPLARILHLIDIRHDPTKDDKSMHEFLLSLGVPLCVVATKLDKISKSSIRPSIQNIKKLLETPFPVVAVSAEKNIGMDELWTMMEFDLSVQEQIPVESSLHELLISSEHTQENEN